jgi:N-methylhydantoinase B
VEDSGGAGFHRGGNGIEKRYVYLEPGEISIHDDRWLTYPWGILGGKPGMRSEKVLQRADGSSERLPSKCDEVRVEPGDVLVFRTAGGGGWKDPLDRPVEQVAADVGKGLVSREKAERDYGVVVDDPAATEQLRARMREERGNVLDFDFGPSLDEIRSRASEETGLTPPVPPEPLPWAPVEPADEALRRVRERGDRQMTMNETG